jgi:hypothetical protein
MTQYKIDAGGALAVRNKQLVVQTLRQEYNAVLDISAVKCAGRIAAESTARVGCAEPRMILARM